MQDRERAQLIITAAQDLKEEEILLYDLQTRSTVTDFIVICSGRSQAHVKGISNKIEARLKECGFAPRGIEGYSEGSWVLLDFDVVIVHIFHPETRLYYDLEGLLQSFPHEPFPPPVPKPPASSDEGTARS